MCVTLFYSFLILTALRNPCTIFKIIIHTENFKIAFFTRRNPQLKLQDVIAPFHHAHTIILFFVTATKKLLQIFFLSSKQIILLPLRPGIHQIFIVRFKIRGTFDRIRFETAVILINQRITFHMHMFPIPLHPFGKCAHTVLYLNRPDFLRFRR